MARLHDVIQRAMGWQDYHLHEFEIGDVRYGIDDGEDWEPPKDERRARLHQVAPLGISFAYQYDFGDCWDHEIEVEALLPQDAGRLYPVCIDGEGACPPEDCGGPSGFAEMVEVLADPDHEEHESMRMWAGEGYDPERFDLAAVNETLSFIAARTLR